MFIQNSELLKSEDKESILFDQQRFKDYIQDHHIVAWVLDPRLHGIGSSPLSLRKVRTQGIVVVDVSNKLPTCLRSKLRYI